MHTEIYNAVAQRLAMRDYVLYFLLTDHLGSTSLTLMSAGAPFAEKRYNAWGTERYN